MPNLATMGVIAPATFASGFLTYTKFPEWLGKNSTTKRIERMIRDVREMCAHHLYADKKAILFESIPLIFWITFNHLKKGDADSVAEAVSVLEDFNLTMDAFKEHIIGLQLDQKNLDDYAALPAPIKGSFTKIYNQVFKSSIKAAARGKRGTGTPTAHFSLHKNFDAGEEMFSESSAEEEEEPEDEVVGELLGGKKGPAKGGVKPVASKAAAPKEAPAANRGGAGRGSTARGRGAAQASNSTYSRGRG
jgi:hypothetical protein